jgi:tyrosine-protein phosphatase
LETIFSPLEVKSESQVEEAQEEEQNFDIPLSQEIKAEAYPDGPICVYDPRIDLYLEPTAEQARQYDVIMNVASEVRNPLVKHAEPIPAEPEIRLDGGGGIQYAPKREHLAVQMESVSETSPTTPKATSSTASFQPETPVKDPEYIHIPWEHNSDIVPDLLRLVKLIDDRVSEGKRILIHCQCGVSRSASLVVAYGIYKNPEASVQEAYDAVKKRSKWIGPNMNLIMQLQEFRSSLARGGALGDRMLSPATPSSALSEWKGPFSDRATPMAGGDAKLPSTDAPAINGTSTEDVPISPGPSSAPSGVPWQIKQTGVSSRTRALSAVKPATAYVDPSGNVVVPVLKLIEVQSPRTTTFSQLAVPTTVKTSQQSLPESPISAQTVTAPRTISSPADPSDAFGLMSPTRREFGNNAPFDRASLLASLGMGSMRSDEEAPRRRALSLRTNRGGQSLHVGSRKLAGKISSPSLREQKQLQELQARIEKELGVRNGSNGGQSGVSLNGAAEEPLLSPRAEEFTQNPFALNSAIPSKDRSAAATAMTKDGGDGISNAVHLGLEDPRSPAIHGASPITRNIEDVL